MAKQKQNQSPPPPPPDIFSLRMKFIIVMIKKLVQQLPSAALAQKKNWEPDNWKK